MYFSTSYPKCHPSRGGDGAYCPAMPGLRGAVIALVISPIDGDGADGQAGLAAQGPAGQAIKAAWAPGFLEMVF